MCKHSRLMTVDDNQKSVTCRRVAYYMDTYIFRNIDTHIYISKTEHSASDALENHFTLASCHNQIQLIIPFSTSP